ncbi:MAG: glycerophosphodiester phosphodiesterase [Herminiimonas sp.]|nr:glycerophosphodiester phosphodiesterase [Herminiimonas sp.]
MVLKKNMSIARAALLASASLVVLLSACGGSDENYYQNPGLAWPPTPAIAGHRGASALRPEHTLASYQRAIDDGADIVEPDLVSTKDGVLIARHENDISGTSDVADKPQFASRKVTKLIDGIPVTGWFTEDFTLAEIKTLRARERIPANRPANATFNGQFEIPTLQEITDLVRQQSQAKARVIGIYPETKHPTYFKSIGLPLERRLVDQLTAAGYRGKGAAVFIQSFEVANLKELRGMTDMRLVQLVDNPKNPPAANGTPRNAPYDFVAAGSTRTYADLITPAGLKEIATYADVVAPYKEIIIARDARNELGPTSPVVADAHAAGLKIHTWTFRPENPFLPPSLRLPDVASITQRGNMVAEINAYLNAGIDGFFTDDPALGRIAVTEFLSRK